MNQDSRSALFMGALIGSGVSFLLLVITDFGGWYNYVYYTQEWGSVGISNPISLLIIVALGSPFLYCAAISLRGVTNPNMLTLRTVSIAFYLSIIELALVFIGAVVFVVAVSDATNWWFGAGFYGPAIGGTLTVICLYSARRITKMFTFMQPMYPPQAQPGFMQPQAQQYQPPMPPQQPVYQPAPQPFYQPPVAQGPPPSQAPVQQMQQPYPQGQPPYPQGVRFCRRCGAQGVGGPFCPRCGYPMQ